MALEEIVGHRNQSFYVRRRLAMVASRRKCRQSISMGFSHGMWISQHSNTKRPAAARTTAWSSSSSWVAALS